MSELLHHQALKHYTGKRVTVLVNAGRTYTGILTGTAHTGRHADPDAVALHLHQDTAGAARAPVYIPWHAVSAIELHPELTHSDGGGS